MLYQSAQIFDLTCVAGVAVDDASESDSERGQWRVLRFIEEPIQIGICNGRQVVFRLGEHGAVVVEQQGFIGDIKRVYLLAGLAVAGAVIPRIRRHVEALVPALGDP